MTSQYASLSECLFDAFVNSKKYDPQDDRQMWALLEGYKRNRQWLILFEYRTANKEHQCVKGCSIQPGEVYFKYEYYPSFDGYIKLCASCTAMIFYFLEVDRSDPHMYTDWDEDAQKPVFRGERKPFTGPSPADSLRKG